MMPAIFVKRSAHTHIHSRHYCHYSSLPPPSAPSECPCQCFPLLWILALGRRYFARLVLYLAISDLWLCTSFLMGRGPSDGIARGIREIFVLLLALWPQCQKLSTLNHDNPDGNPYEAPLPYSGEVSSIGHTTPSAPSRPCWVLPSAGLWTSAVCILLELPGPL